MVGEEHRDQGWRSLSRDHLTQKWKIRLPDWHEGPVAEVLLACRWVCSDSRNNFWLWELDLPISEARQFLAPVLAAGTRLADETELAQSLAERGKCFMVPQWSQLELF